MRIRRGEVTARLGAKSPRCLPNVVGHRLHWRALNVNRPGPHYRNVSVVNVVGPEFVCDPTDPMIEGPPLEKGFCLRPLNLGPVY